MMQWIVGNTTNHRRRLRSRTTALLPYTIITSHEPERLALFAFSLLTVLPYTPDHSLIWLEWVALMPYCVSRRHVLDDGVAPPYKSSLRPHAHISTPLRNITLLNVWRHSWRRRFVFAYFANRAAVSERRWHSWTVILLINRTPGSPLLSAWTSAAVAYNRPTRSRFLRLQTSSRSSATNASMCMISDVRRFHDAISCFFHDARWTQMAQQCPTLHCTTNQQVEWSPVLPQKTEADSACCCCTSACPLSGPVCYTDPPRGGVYPPDFR